MRFLVGCLGAAIGAFVGFALLPTIYFLFHPRRGCMDGLAILPMYPFMFLGSFVGMVTGFVSAPPALTKLITLLVNAVSALGRKTRARRKRKHKAEPWP